MAAETPKKNKPTTNSGLKKCFAALVDRKQVNLDLDVLTLMLKHELFLNMDTLDENLSSIMPFMLVVYIKNWPGWQRSKEYYSGKLNFREWYEKFRQYIILRLNFLIQNGYSQALELMSTDEKNESRQLNPNLSFQNNGTQTENSVRKAIAPFSISVQCPPNVIGSMVFTDSGDDIFLKQHAALPWSQIGLTELLNWPHIGVEFESIDLSFRRFNRSKYMRFLNLTSCPIEPEEPDFIEKVEISNPKIHRACYTLKRLKCYTDQLLDVVQYVDRQPTGYMDILKVVIEEFLKDIEEIGMNNTMATNTKVLFNIGRSSFIRNKKVSHTRNHHGSKVDVGYCEKIVPKMEIELKTFNSTQDISTNGVTFTSLNALRKIAPNINSRNEISLVVPVLLFHCLFCEITFANHNEVLKHLEIEHRMEPNFMCDKCMTLIPITVLTKIRWKHVCKSSHNPQSSRAAVSRK